MPNSYALTENGILFIADGMSPMMKWDGLDGQLSTVGVKPPATALTLSSSGTGSLSGTYTAYVRFVDGDGNYSDLSPISNELTVTNVGSIVYTNVPVPEESKVVRRQILRNTSGQADTYYVDIDTMNLSETTFASTRSDTDLATQEDVPIFLPDGRPNANRFGLPPNHKAVIARHLDRMFAAVDVEYTRGSVQVTHNSTTVKGIGTEWTSAMKGRFLWVAGALRSYEIASVDESKQILTLTSAYEEDTNLFASYGIRPAPAERRLIYWSEAGLPEAWPAFNAMPLQDDGDEITGLFANGSYLFIVERRHIYRFTFKDDPALDGAVFQASNRGCINHRCYLQVEDTVYMLDELGVHAFNGSESEPISSPIQSIFKGTGRFRINWRASKFFHAVHSLHQDVLRWFVTLSGDYLPRHALAYDLRRQAWWLEEYHHPIGSSATMILNGDPAVFVGSEAKRIFALWQGTLDGVRAEAGDVRGPVTSATPTSLTSTGASYPPEGVVGSPVAIVAGRGKGQVRTIVQVQGSTLVVREPWLILPDSTSVYQIGGIGWQYRTGVFRLLQDERNAPRRVEVAFYPTQKSATMNVRVVMDRSKQPLVWSLDHIFDDGRGATVKKGLEEVECDLTKANGFVQHRLDGSKDYYLDGPRYLQVELGGFTNADRVAIVGVMIDGVAK